MRILGGIQKGEYSQTYCISPGKSYVIEAQGGELPYEIAEKEPQRFYNQVLRQEIKKYNIKMRGKLTAEWTQRPLLKIITSIKEKLIERIGDNIGHQFQDDIKNAFADGEVDEHFMEIIQNQQVDLVDDEKVPILQKQVTSLAEKEEQNRLAAAGTGSKDQIFDDEEGESVNIRIESPDAKRLENAKLEIGEKQFSDLEDKVKKYVRRTSLLKEAQDL